MNAKQKYRRTKKWKEFRREVLKDTPYCELCGSMNKKLSIHHKDENAYEHETRKDVAVLCSSCHRHFIERLLRRKKFHPTKYTDLLSQIVKDFTEVS